MICYSQLNKFGQYLFARFRAVLCQKVHPNSNISYFHQFSLWCSALWIFIKTRLRVRKSNFKIFFATSLGSLAVSRPSLVNSFLTDFGGVPSQPVHAESNIRFLAVFLFDYLPWLFLKLVFEWERLGSLLVSRSKFVNLFLTDFGHALPTGAPTIIHGIFETNSSFRVE